MDPITALLWILVAFGALLMLGLAALIVGGTIAGIRAANRKSQHRPNDHQTL